MISPGKGARPDQLHSRPYLKGGTMKLDEFMLLEENEKSAFLQAEEGKQKEIEELTAERDSLKNDNNDLVKKNNDLAAENLRVKTTNYSLSRQIKTQEGTIREDPETIIHNMFKRGDNTT